MPLQSPPTTFPDVSDLPVFFESARDPDTRQLAIYRDAAIREFDFALGEVEREMAALRRAVQARAAGDLTAARYAEQDRAAYARKAKGNQMMVAYWREQIATKRAAMALARRIAA
ncbi:hypothetical protein [Salinarimonas soli]|uniref:Uncharacterized protein n=1 Tax=Salinarimonas soli TaxID=1638099 RepID=A0A5B2VF18_9HYPH|nr:hypothetical protein [Salinarimonas soli]KAA2237711.1 hypothetical protein F0L46_08515 [Salinarimonas soli]